MNWYKVPEICDFCKIKDECCAEDMRCCCKLCHHLGNDNRCDDCNPIEVEE